MINETRENREQESQYAAIFAHLTEQDIEQFYAQYQLWVLRRRLPLIEKQLEALREHLAANQQISALLRPSALAQAALVRLQASGVTDNDLLDQMLERGEGWLDHMMQRLDYCEQVEDFIQGNYTQWCQRSLDGAYDWIDTMMQGSARPEQAAPVDGPDSGTTAELLLAKLRQEDEESMLATTLQPPDISSTSPSERAPALSSEPTEPLSPWYSIDVTPNGTSAAEAVGPDFSDWITVLNSDESESSESPSAGQLSEIADLEPSETMTEAASEDVAVEAEVSEVQATQAETVTVDEAWGETTVIEAVAENSETESVSEEVAIEEAVEVEPANEAPSAEETEEATKEEPEPEELAEPEESAVELVIAPEAVEEEEEKEPDEQAADAGDEEELVVEAEPVAEEELVVEAEPEEPVEPSDEAQEPPTELDTASRVAAVFGEEMPPDQRPWYEYLEPEEVASVTEDQDAIISEETGKDGEAIVTFEVTEPSAVAETLELSPINNLTKVDEDASLDASDANDEGLAEIFEYSLAEALTHEPTAPLPGELALEELEIWQDQLASAEEETQAIPRQTSAPTEVAPATVIAIPTEEPASGSSEAEETVVQTHIVVVEEATVMEVTIAQAAPVQEAAVVLDEPKQEKKVGFWRRLFGRKKRA